MSHFSCDSASESGDAPSPHNAANSDSEHEGILFSTHGLLKLASNSDSLCSATTLAILPAEGEMKKSTPVYFPHSILEDCAQRDSRCAHALRVRYLDDMYFPQAEQSHTFATVLSAHCTACSSWRLCTHAKSKFNSTHNSKRRVHTLLFWKLMLGMHFPVPDSLLQDAVWRNLDSCAYGIKRSNGHAKQSGKVCINPHHYSPVDYSSILAALIEAVVAMGLFAQHQRVFAIICLRQSVGDPKETFLMLCECLRSISPTSNPLACV